MKNTTWLSAVCIAIVLMGSLLAFSSPMSPRSESSPAEPACCKVKANDCPGKETAGDMLHESLYRQFL